MKKLILGLLFVLFTGMLCSQTVFVFDETTEKPIANAGIVNFSETHSVITNQHGKASLDGFSEKDNLLFQHASYQSRLIRMSEIKKMDYQVPMYLSVIKLSETVISANRWEQEREEVPMKIEVISPTDISMMEPQTSADMLAGSGHVFVQKSQLGGGSPMIRGFATNKVLIVVDGIRMNNAIYRHGNLQNVLSIDPNALEGSEVIFGPGSVIYGSDAIGGVMDFHTLEPAFAQSDTMVFDGSALLRYHSGNNGKTGHFDVNIAGEKFSSLTSVSYSKFGDLNMGINGLSEDLEKYYLHDLYVTEVDGQDSVVPNKDKHLARKSGFNQTHLLQKFAYNLNENTLLKYNFYYSTTSDVPRYDRLIQKSDGNPKYAEWYYGPQKWMVHSIGLELNKKRKSWDEMKIQAAYQDYEESRHDRKLRSEMLRHRTENLKIGNLNLDAFKKFDGQHTLYYGLEAGISKVFSDAYRENIHSDVTEDIASRYPDNSDYSHAGLYLSYRYLLNPQWTFTTGARLNGVYAYSPFDDRFYDFPFSQITMDLLAPNFMAGAVYKPEPGMQVCLNLGSGFRAPNIDDMGKVFDSEPGSVVVPNDDLQPEYAWNADINISKTFSKILRIEGCAFYTIITNAMVRDDYQFGGQDSIMYDGELSQVQAIQNIGRVDVYGFNGGIYADMTKNISVKSLLTKVYGYDQDENPYRHVPPLYGSTHAIFRSGQLSIDASVDYNGEISPDELSPEEHNKTHMYAVDESYARKQSELPESKQFNPEGLYAPSWYAVNLKLSYAMSKNLVFSAGVENLTDQLYRTYSSGIPAMGRSFILSLRGTF
ncbi:MAG: TonB-dependent receptor [Bacteroidota bacterium]|nr:TonB-dependent receptor [Bacteroidota bacterium]